MNQEQENLSFEASEEENTKKDLTREANEQKQSAAQAAEDTKKAREEFQDGNVGAEHPHEEKDTSYMDEYVEDKKNKLSIGKILKYALYGVILFVFLFSIYRIFVQNKDYSDYLLWNDQSVAAYKEKKKLTVWTQDMSSFTFALERDENGIPIEDNEYVYTYSPFSEREVIRKIAGTTETKTISFRGVYKTSGPMYIEETKQLIITFRVNRTANGVLQELYELDTKPSGDIYIFTLQDNQGNIYTDYDYVTFSENTYYYYRLVFNNVNYPFPKNYLEVTAADIIELKLNVFYKDLFNINSPVDTMTVGNNLITPDRYDLDDALPAKVDPDLKSGYNWAAYYPDDEETDDSNK